jgi:hypothetical protein
MDFSLADCLPGSQEGSDEGDGTHPHGKQRDNGWQGRQIAPAAQPGDDDAIEEQDGTNDPESESHERGVSTV